MTHDPARIAAAERRLRDSDPLRALHRTDTASAATRRATLERIRETPRDRPGRGASRSRRAARAAVGAVGLAALGALIALLLVSTRGGDGQGVASVSPPARVYSILTRPQTADEAAREVNRYPTGSHVIHSSVRVADPGPDGDYLIFRTASGELCLFAEGRRGGAGGGCGMDLRRPRPGIVGGEIVGNVQRLYGLVPDGIVSVSVNGRAVPVRDNVFHTDLPAGTRTAVVDYRTDQGVVTAWHQTMPVAIPPRTIAPEAAYGEQARLLQRRPPHMGIACPGADSIACDRVGLTVWLRRPARRVVAKIDGRRLILDDPTFSGPATNGLRRRFAGYLRPAGLAGGLLGRKLPPGTTRWAGVPAIRAHVIINVFYADGSVGAAAMRIRLSPRWR
jgi:hypothetical protein